MLKPGPVSKPNNYLFFRISYWRPLMSSDLMRQSLDGLWKSPIPCFPGHTHRLRYINFRPWQVLVQPDWSMPGKPIISIWRQRDQLVSTGSWVFLAYRQPLFATRFHFFVECLARLTILRE